jgi:hypothetical protein
MIWIPALAAVQIIRMNQENSGWNKKDGQNGTASPQLRSRGESTFQCLQTQIEICRGIGLFEMNEVGEPKCDEILTHASMCL